jgi:hypothetical protein
LPRDLDDERERDFEGRDLEDFRLDFPRELFFLTCLPRPTP